MKRIIEIENVSKIYKMYGSPKDRLKEALSIRKKKYHKDFYAVKDISLTIKKGEIIGLLGRNGAGKSTLLKLITGVLTPTVGKISAEGRISALIELGAGFNREYTGMENIYLYGTLQGQTKEETNQKLQEILEFADIGDFINQPIKTYSSGMFARLAFSVAINVKPEILIVDEILAVGDLAFQLKCMEKMKKMMKNGTTIIFVSHNLNSIRRFCTKSFWVNKGELKMQGNTEVVCDAYEDFLKKNSKKKNEKLNENSLKEKKIEIAEIESLRVLDGIGNSLNIIAYDEKIELEIIYNVYEAVEKPILGVALRSADDEYICGLNTLLDQVTIPWEKGKNKIILKYQIGLLSVGGSYYFDIALFEETATISIDYKSKIKDITIRSGYKGEGKYIIPHEWRVN